MNVQELRRYIKEPLWQNWYIKEKIGEGSFSIVYRIEAKRPTRTDVSALKVEAITADDTLYLDEQRKKAFIDSKRNNIQNESAIMYKLRHSPYIVNYEEEDLQQIIVNGSFQGYLFLVKMELLSCVTTMIQRKQMDFSENNIRKLASEIGQGILAAHEIGVIHRDIKPGNFFFSQDMKNGIYKLGDFNISKQTQTAHTFAGTEGYLAPEIYMAKSNANHLYNAQADIYSFGICLYQFMNNLYFPFEETCPTEEAIRKRLCGASFPPPKNASSDFARIIMKSCAFRPYDRYRSMNELLADLKMIAKQPPHCRVCDSILSANAKFCKKCGTPVYPQSQTKKICPYCHACINKNAVFCTKCGRRLL